MKRNPWIGALWAIGVAMIVGSWSATIWRYSYFYQPTGGQNVEPVIEFLQQLFDILSYPALMVGFATIGGLLFLHARNHAQPA